MERGAGAQGLILRNKKQQDEGHVTQSNIRGLLRGQKVRGWGGKKELMERGAGTQGLILRNKKQGN